MAKSPQEVAKKWAQRLSTSTADITAGVAGVTESPMEKAAMKQDKMRQKLIESIDSGKWAAGLRRVTLAQWKQAMNEKGIQRIASGAQAAESKMAQFMSELLPYEQTVQQEIANLPDLSLEDSVVRASTWIRRMAQFKRSR